MAGISAENATPHSDQRSEKQPLKKTITLPMFAKDTQLTVYSDDDQLNGSVKQVKQNKKKQLTITIPENGGCLIVGNI